MKEGKNAKTAVRSMRSTRSRSGLKERSRSSPQPTSNEQAENEGWRADWNVDLFIGLQMIQEALETGRKRGRRTHERDGELELSFLSLPPSSHSRSTSLYLAPSWNGSSYIPLPAKSSINLASEFLPSQRISTKIRPRSLPPSSSQTCPRSLLSSNHDHQR